MGAEQKDPTDPAEDPWDLGVGGILNAQPADTAHLPVLTLAAEALLIQHLAERVSDEGKQTRLRGIAARRVIDGNTAIERLPEAASLPRLTHAPTQLRKLIHKRVPESVCLGLLVSACNTSVTAPFHVRVDKAALGAALSDLASDLGCPRAWATHATTTSRMVQKLHQPNPAVRYVIMALGVGAMIAALPLAVFFAPAGLAGGAAFLAGLAALGPGGLMGGLAIVASVAAAGGITATAGALVSGTASEVEARVIILHATALAKREIRPGTKSGKELKMLESMLKALKDLRELHAKLDDPRSGSLTEIDKKSKSIQKSIKHLKEMT